MRESILANEEALDNFVSKVSSKDEKKARFTKKRGSQASRKKPPVTKAGQEASKVRGKRSREKTSIKGELAKIKEHMDKIKDINSHMVTKDGTMMNVTTAVRKKGNHAKFYKL